MTLDNFPTTRPSFTANFARSQQLPPQVKFTRASTGTYVSENGFIETAATDVSRFTWENGKCQGLMIEVDKTNLITNADFTTWTANAGTPTVTPNAGIAPDGTNSAYSFTAGAGDLTSIRQTNTTNNPRVLTVYAKSDGTLTEFTIDSYWWDAGITAGATFNLITGENLNLNTGFGVTGYSEEVGNGWRRYVVTIPQDTSSSNRNAFCIFAGRKTTNPAGSVLLWAPQAEEAPLYPTSYIPTAGATATRAKDIFDISGDDFFSWYNSGKSTLVVNMAIKEAQQYDMLWGFYGGKRIEGFPGYLTPFEGLIFFQGDNGTNVYIGRGNTGEAYWNQDGDMQKCAYTWNFDTGEGAVKLQDRPFAPEFPPATNVPTTTITVGFRLMGGQNSTHVYNSGTVASVYYYPHKVSLDALEALTQ